MKKKIILSSILLIFIIFININVFAAYVFPRDFVTAKETDGSDTTYAFKIESTNNNERKITMPGNDAGYITGPIMKTSSESVPYKYEYTNGGSITIKVFDSAHENYQVDSDVIIGIETDKGTIIKYGYFSFLGGEWGFYNKEAAKAIDIEAKHNGDHIIEMKITFNKESNFKYLWLDTPSGFGGVACQGDQKKIIEFSYNSGLQESIDAMKERVEKIQEVQKGKDKYSENKLWPTKLTKMPDYKDVLDWMDGMAGYYDTVDKMKEAFTNIYNHPGGSYGFTLMRGSLNNAKNNLSTVPIEKKYAVVQYHKALDEILTDLGSKGELDKNKDYNLHSSSEQKEHYQNQLKTEMEQEVKIFMELLPKVPGETRNPKPNFTDVLTNIEEYTPTQDDTDNSKVEEMTGKILTIITNIGMILAIIVPAILGVKYMLGSVEEKAEYKKGIIPYIVGSILLFGICTFVKVLQQFGESINNI